MIRLIATDLDGTLLSDHTSIHPRTMAALHAATDAGITVIAATGRQSRLLPVLLDGAPITKAVASNGAIGLDLSAGEILFDDPLPATQAAAVVGHLVRVAPGTVFCAVRSMGDRHAAEPGYVRLADGLEQQLVDFDTVDIDTLVSEPTLKLTARHPELTPDDLLALLAQVPGGFHATTSGAPFLEIAGPSVTKASGLSRICTLLGVEASEVLAAGDALNDVEMLAWAGIGVAMGDAVPEAIAAADWVSTAHDEAGLAVAIEAVLEGALTR